MIATPTERLELMALRPHERPQFGAIPPFEIHRAHEKDGEGFFVRMKLWNIGLGPAIVEQVRLRRSNVDFLDSLGRFYTLGAGHAADIEIPSLRWKSSCAATLTITYRHASGRQYTTNSEVTIQDEIVSCLTYKRSRVDERAGLIAQLEGRS